MSIVHRNLVSDSPLVQETIELLRLCGGRAPVTQVADLVLNLPDPDPQFAAIVVSELIKDDGRLCLNNDGFIELLYDPLEDSPLYETDFVVVDVETTGAKLATSRITEIGAYRVSQGRIVAEFETLVNPQSIIPQYIVQLTGITNAMVRTAPVFGDIAADWLRFIDMAILVAHNAPFDMSFLNREVARVYPGRRMANLHLCTVTMSRRVLPGLPNYKLHTIAEHLRIPIRQRHRAASDALATAEIFLRMLEIFRINGVRSLAEARCFRVQTDG